MCYNQAISRDRGVTDMNWILPGTSLTADIDRPEAADELFSSLFVAGGLVLSQVCQITGLEPYAVQNWVKRGFLTPPEKKKYSRRQLGRIVIINMLKNVMPMESICKLISSVNGQLNDERDDIIDDSLMYLMFVHLATQCRDTWPPANLDAAMAATLTEYQEPCSGAKRRVALALSVMLTAWFASQLQKQASEQLIEMGI